MKERIKHATAEVLKDNRINGTPQIQYKISGTQFTETSLAGNI